MNQFANFNYPYISKYSNPAFKLPIVSIRLFRRLDFSSVGINIIINKKDTSLSTLMRVYLSILKL